MARLTCFLAIAAAFLLSIGTGANATTILIDRMVSNGNGSFEGEPTGRQVAGASIDGWSVESFSGFTGFDSIAAANGTVLDGARVHIANAGDGSVVVSDAIPLSVNANDRFDVTGFTNSNFTTDGQTFDYAFSVRFDGDATTDLLLTGGTHDTGTRDWTERNGSALAPAAATSVQLVITLDNSNGQGDQVYIDDVTFSVTAVPEPTAIALSLLGIAGVVARRRR